MARNNIHQFVAKKRAEKTEQLLPYDLGDLLIGELERAFSEPLDDLDMDEEQRQRILESF